MPTALPNARLAMLHRLFLLLLALTLAAPPAFADSSEAFSAARDGCAPLLPAGIGRCLLEVRGVATVHSCTLATCVVRMDGAVTLDGLRGVSKSATLDVQVVLGETTLHYERLCMASTTDARATCSAVAEVQVALPRGDCAMLYVPAYGAHYLGLPDPNPTYGDVRGEVRICNL